MIEGVQQFALDIAESEGEQPGAALKHESCSRIGPPAEYAKYCPSSDKISGDPTTVTWGIVVIAHPGAAPTQVSAM